MDCHRDDVLNVIEAPTKGTKETSNVMDALLDSHQ